MKIVIERRWASDQMMNEKVIGRAEFQVRTTGGLMRRKELSRKIVADFQQRGVETRIRCSIAELISMVTNRPVLQRRGHTGFLRRYVEMLDGGHGPVLILGPLGRDQIYVVEAGTP